MKTIIYLSLGFMLLSSCGPSEAEKAAAEKAKQDSIVKVTEEATRQRIEQEQIAEKAKQDSLAAVAAAAAANDASKAQLQQELSDAQTQLKIANEKLASVKEFKFGRTSSEKDAAIANQYKVIQHWEDEIRRIEAALK